MQEEVEQKTMTLSINATKFSGRVLKAAVSKYLAHRRNTKAEKKHEKQSYQDVIPHGKQKMKDLIGQNQGVSNLHLSLLNLDAQNPYDQKSCCRKSK